MPISYMYMARVWNSRWLPPMMLPLPKSSGSVKSCMPPIVDRIDHEDEGGLQHAAG